MLQCECNSFYAKFDAVIHDIIDKDGNIVEETKIDKKLDRRKFSTLYICTDCNSEYVRLNPLYKHAK